MATIFIKSLETKYIFHRLFNILEIKKIEEKNFIYLPITNKNSDKRIHKAIKKLNKYLHKNNIQNIVLEQSLVSNEKIKQTIRDNGINILDGARLNKFLICKLMDKIYQYMNKNIETSEITLLINKCDDIIIQEIQMIANEVKKLNIITSNINQFKKLVNYLYNELGILIKLSNKYTINLKSSDIIINVDFTEKMLNDINIPNNAIVLNIPQNININTKRFVGINIKNWELIIPDKYKLVNFDNASMYEANIYGKTIFQIIEQIQKDKLQVGNLFGRNGIINSKEFVNDKLFISR